MNQPLWRPKLDGTTPLEKLQSSLGFDDYWQLHNWSLQNPGEFWGRVWDELSIIGEKGDSCYEAGSDFLTTKFFPNATLNIAENLLYRGADNELAIISISELGERQELTWRELREWVSATSAAMEEEGIAAGDRIASWTPNLIETIVWALAAQSLGAVVSTASPDFAPVAVAERFGQIEPKLLLVAETYRYNGKDFDLTSKIEEIAQLLPTLKRIVTTTGLRAFSERFQGVQLKFNRLPFDHPGFILFSSGTTGKPKCIVHSAAGVLLKVGEEVRFQFDIRKGDRVLFYTTCGWMMWNWLLLNLITGATIVLYDGSPGSPNIDRLLEIAAAEQLTFLGASAKYLDSLRKLESELGEHDLRSLRMIGSTGSVLAPETFDFIYSKIKADVHLASLSGGTDICGCFLASVPTLPVYRGELQAPCLGMAVDVFDENGHPAAVGVKGELVCKSPFPSKPIGFWSDPEDSRYRSAYFEGFPGVWTHGDFAAKSDTGGYVIFGRSDATLNAKGVRIGTAEIYRVVEKFPEILESMAVAQDWDSDSRVILFITLKAGVAMDGDMESRIKKALRDEASPRHVPDKIIVAPELPRTKSNKLVELAVTDVINGRTVRNQNALANPGALDWFKDLAQLRS